MFLGMSNRPALWDFGMRYMVGIVFTDNSDLFYFTAINPSVH